MWECLLTKQRPRLKGLWSADSIRSYADLESFFVRFVFKPFSFSPRPWLFSGRPDSVSLCLKGKVLIKFCISVITLSLIAELLDRLIWVCIMLIHESIFGESLIFISVDRISVDSNSLSCLGASFPGSLSLISFSWDEVERQCRNGLRACLWHLILFHLNLSYPHLVTSNS